MDEVHETTIQRVVAWRARCTCGWLGSEAWPDKVDADHERASHILQP